jgi:hypothetical protein
MAKVGASEVHQVKHFSAAISQVEIEAIGALVRIHSSLGERPVYA